MNTTKIIKKIKLLSLLSLLVATKLFAYTEFNTITHSVDGYDIPIKIYLPDDKSISHPVQFVVHGGGWNGGTADAVPPATVQADADVLCDRLGIIYVGLAYRCKGNNGTFAKAIDDLENSISWFMSRAKEFNADLNRIGFSGGSAGTTLASVLAQKYPNCKAFYGTEGMYNLIIADKSNFPNTKSRADYGLSEPEQARAASAFYNLKKNPPAALLFHGKDDWLCDPNQSVNFAEKIKKSGGNANTILYDKINHTCMDVNYPDVYKNTVFEIAKFLSKEFGLAGFDTTDVLENLETRAAKFYPVNPVLVESILGNWINKERDKVSFEPNGVCSFNDLNSKSVVSGTYTIEDSKISAVHKDIKKEYFYRKDGAVCEKINRNDQHKSRVFKYVKIE